LGTIFTGTLSNQQCQSTEGQNGLLRHKGGLSQNECDCNDHRKNLHEQQLTDWFNGTFSTNRLYRAFGKYIAVKKVKFMGKLTM